MREGPPLGDKHGRFRRRLGALVHCFTEAALPIVDT